MDPESITAYIEEEKFHARLVAVLEEKPFMIYRTRDPENGKLEGHFTVVNEDEKHRRGHTGRTLMEAFNAAFPEQNAPTEPRPSEDLTSSRETGASAQVLCSPRKFASLLSMSQCSVEAPKFREWCAQKVQEALAGNPTPPQIQAPEGQSPPDSASRLRLLRAEFQQLFPALAGCSQPE